MPARPRGSKLHARESSHVGPLPEVVYEGRVLHRGRIVPAEVGVADGWIVKVAPVVRGGRRVDLEDALILPSAIDLHVHFREPSPPGAAEDLGTGTVQAALGGVGAVVDMPNTEPPTTDLERLEEKTSRARGRIQVDLLLLAALTPRTRVRELAARAAGFKLYLAPSTGDLAWPEGEDLRRPLEEIAACGSALHVHAEDPHLFGEADAAADPEGWNRVRPASSELAALDRLTPSPEGLLLHVAHATTRATVERARKAGASVEATPHHLLLSANMLRDGRGKVNPPLRSPAERAELFEAFRRGEVTMLASDHAPHPAAAKVLPFPRVPSGVPGVETMLPLMLERARLGEIDLPVLLRATSGRPALFLGLPRGEIAPGREANFLVVDFRDRKVLRARELHAPCGWTPFEGREGVFPRAHYLRGQRIVEDGEFVGSGVGALLQRGRPLPFGEPGEGPKGPRGGLTPSRAA